jgi:eukaryotic-like serine/threonine-protein kinase
MMDATAVSTRYRVVRPLGRGGMATVFLARDRELERLVALKVLAPGLADDEAFRDRFLREARLAAKVLHPNVVQVYDVGESELGPFIVIEYVEGRTLADELRRRGPLPAAEVAEIGIQLCAGLAAAHAERLVHRDVKPQNILRRPNGQVKIADFGIARSLAATRHTELGTVLGTAAYLAPEQARGEPVTAAADIYSLGVVLYELLTGRTPFDASSLPELLARLEQPAAIPPGELAAGVPPSLESAVMRCLADRPEYRPGSAAELARLLAGTTGGGEAPTLVVAPGRASRRRRRVAVGVAVAAALALALVAAAALSRGPERRSGTTTPATTATSSPRHAAKRHPAPKTAAVHATATPERELTALRTAVAAAVRSGNLDPGAANDLGQRIDGLEASVARGDRNGEAGALDDLLHRLGDLSRGGALTAGGLAAIQTPLERLARLLGSSLRQAAPAPPGPAAPPAPSQHGRRHGPPHGPKGKGPGHE